MKANNTQMGFAKQNIITEEMRYVANCEEIDPEFIRSEISCGRLIIPRNINHTNLKPVGVGIALKCKINANIGNSPDSSDKETELEKLKIAIKYGADTVMDLSVGKDINNVRKLLIENCCAPLGTVPIYQALQEVKNIENLTPALILDIIEFQAKQGVDFMTIHAGLLLEHIPLTRKRITGIVSRGGTIIAKWMLYHNKQNPLYSNFDKILDICRKYDVTLSLGDGLRPGSLADASDEAQFAELNILGELTLKAWEKDVQVMIEGPGHVPFNQIAMNVMKEIEICHGAPFYVLGPVVTDIAPGYDHITSAIGATMAAYSGASLLCYVTPKEHLGLPSLEDVKQGVIAYKIAAHAADIARGRKGARDKDDEISKARYNFDWKRQFELSLDPELALSYYNKNFSEDYFKNEYCTMCGENFCAIKANRQLRERSN